MDSVEDFGFGAIGFVYEVEHIPTGKKYIGKKNLFTERKKLLGKREFEHLKEERKQQGIPGATPKKKIVKKESDWRRYYGSSKEVKSMVRDTDKTDWKRTILKICTTKKQLTYWELKLQMINGVIESDDYLNENLIGKFWKKDT